MTTKTVVFRKRYTGESWEKSEFHPNDHVYVTTSRDLTQERIGQANPKWRSQIRDGLSATTTLSGVRQSLEFDPCRCTIFWHRGADPSDPKWQIIETCGTIGYKESFNVVLPPIPLGNPFSASVPNADAIATRLLYRKIQQFTSQFQGGVFVGELSKAIRMFANPIRGLAKGIESFVHAAKKVRSRTTPRRAVRKITDLYLEATYGWTPFMVDVDDAMHALARLNYGGEKKRFRVFGQDNVQLTPPTTGVASDNNRISVFYRYNEKYEDIAEVIYYGGFKGDLYVPDSLAGTLSRARDLAGFNLSDFVPTLWELVPWSFFVDYFTNIGDVIQAASTVTSNVKWNVRVTRKSTVKLRTLVPDEAKTRANFPGAPAQFMGVDYSGQMAQKAAYTDTQRVASGVPFPALRFEVPGAKQTLNIVALGISQLTRIRKGTGEFLFR